MSNLISTFDTKNHLVSNKSPDLPSTIFQRQMLDSELLCHRSVGQQIFSYFPTFSFSEFNFINSYTKNIQTTYFLRNKHLFSHCYTSLYQVFNFHVIKLLFSLSWHWRNSKKKPPIENWDEMSIHLFEDGTKY